MDTVRGLPEVVRGFLEVVRGTLLTLSTQESLYSTTKGCLILEISSFCEKRDTEYYYEQ